MDTDNQKSQIGGMPPRNEMLAGLFHACGSRGLTLSFDTEAIFRVASSLERGERTEEYRQQANTIVNALCEHIPSGLYEAILDEAKKRLAPVGKDSPPALKKPLGCRIGWNHTRLALSMAVVMNRTVSERGSFGTRRDQLLYRCRHCGLEKRVAVGIWIAE